MGRRAWVRTAPLSEPVPSRATRPGAVHLQLLSGEGPPLSATQRSLLRWSEGSERLRVVAEVVLAFGRGVEAWTHRWQVEAADEARLLEFARLSGLGADDLDVEGALSRLALAGAGSEVLSGRLPCWNPAHFDDESRSLIWACEALEVLEAPAGPVPAHWASWSRGGSELEFALTKPFARDGWASGGPALLELWPGLLRIEERDGVRAVELSELRALELCRDAVVLDTPHGRHALVVEEAWLLAEMLRLHGEGAPRRPSPLAPDENGGLQG